MQVALLQNEFGDVAIDSQLASSRAISGVRELLNGCICCNLVDQLSDALIQLRHEVAPDRIVIETSGSAFPATLAMEVNRLARETDNQFVLDGVISVIDVENWKGYEDTSYTAKLQAKYTDLIVFNKWELVDETRFEECLDRVGDLELQVAWVKSQKGWVDKNVVLGVDVALTAKQGQNLDLESLHHHGNDHRHDHQSEVEVLSVTVTASEPAVVDLEALETFLLSTPKDEVYRIKAPVASSRPPADSSGETASSMASGAAPTTYVLNWAFGRWHFTPLPATAEGPQATRIVVRMTIIFARGEAARWKKKIEAGGLLELEGGMPMALKVDKIA